MNNDERPKPAPPPTRASMNEEARSRFAEIQAIDLDAIRNPSLRMDPEINSLLESDLMGSFPSSVPGITVCVSSKEGEGGSIGSEDACAISKDGTRFAISDGVSNSNLPRPFAAILVQKWVETPIFSPDPNDWQEWLRKPRTAWEIWVADEWINHVNQNRVKKGMSLRDKTEMERTIREVLTKGASATFLGVELDRQQQTIRALAIGDSCMFLIRPSRKKYDSFPLNDPSEFTNLPSQIVSQEEHGVRGYKEASMVYDPGDTLILATDAFSKWLMEGLNSNFDSAYIVLKGLNNQNFRDFIERSWINKEMEVDDATLMLVSLGNASLRHLPPRVLPPPLLTARRVPRID